MSTNKNGANTSFITKSSKIISTWNNNHVINSKEGYWKDSNQLDLKKLSRKKKKLSRKSGRLVEEYMWDKSPSLIYTHFEKLVHRNKVKICSTPRSHAHIVKFLMEVMNWGWGKSAKMVLVVDSALQANNELLAITYYFE